MYNVHDFYLYLVGGTEKSTSTSYFHMSISQWSENFLKLHRVSFTPVSLRILIHECLVFVLVVCSNCSSLVPKCSCEKFNMTLCDIPGVHRVERWAFVKGLLNPRGWVGVGLKSTEASIQELSKWFLGFTATHIWFRLSPCIQELSFKMVLKFPKDHYIKVSIHPILPWHCLWLLPHHWPGHSTLQESPSSFSVPTGYTIAGPLAST